MFVFFSDIIENLKSVIDVAVHFLQAPLSTQLILVLFSLVFFAIASLFLYYICLRLAGLFYTVYANWYLPAFEAILTKRMVAAKYSGEQINAALAGRSVGRPVFRDKSKDLPGQSPTEDEMIFEELEKLDAEINALDDANSDLGQLVQMQHERLKIFEELNPDFRKNLIAEIEKKEKRLAKKL